MFCNPIPLAEKKMPFSMFRTKDSLRDNDIARITSDFKMNLINLYPVVVRRLEPRLSNYFTVNYKN